MKSKPVIVVVVTLLIGFVLGMLTSAQIRYHRLKPMKLYFSEERFREGFYKAIQPDDKQKTEIDKIISKYAKINSELQISFRKKLETNMKDLRKELDSNLSKEQLDRLKEMDDRRQEMTRQNKRSHENDTIINRSERRHISDDKPNSGEAELPKTLVKDSVKNSDKK